MRDLKPNNMMLQTGIKIITFIVFAFSIYLFFTGHNNPGGGFIGGLMTASAILLLYLAFDKKIVNKTVSFNFTTIIGVGLLFAVATGIIGIFFEDPFLTQYFDYFQFPIFGEVELTTALPFDLGVYLVVVGAAMTIILAIAGDDA
ncbi:Na(+)/H(+) antiporter subunit B [Oceanobacillus sp. CAU 1775]